MVESKVMKYNPYDRLLIAAKAQPMPDTGNEELDKYLQRCRNERIKHYEDAIHRIDAFKN